MTIDICVGRSQASFAKSGFRELFEPFPLSVSQNGIFAESSKMGSYTERLTVSAILRSPKRNIWLKMYYSHLCTMIPSMYDDPLSVSQNGVFANFFNDFLWEVRKSSILRDSEIVQRD